MSIKRYDARRDANELPIVKALRDIGASIKRLDHCDLLVGWRGRNFLLEVKGERGQLTESQEQMTKTWRGQYEIVRSVDEAFRAIGAQN